MITFEELQAMFDAKDIDFDNYEGESSFHDATGAGRGYAVQVVSQMRSSSVSMSIIRISM